MKSNRTSRYPAIGFLPREPCSCNWPALTVVRRRIHADRDCFPVQCDSPGMDRTNERPVIARLVRPVKPADETVEVAFEALTDREVEVLSGIAGGNRNRDIAEKLFITEETVKVHVKHIMEKLGASDRTQAVAIGVRRGIIQL